MGKVKVRRYLTQMTLGPTMVGIVGGAPMSLLAAWLLFRNTPAED